MAENKKRYYIVDSNKVVEVDVLKDRWTLTGRYICLTIDGGMAVTVDKVHTKKVDALQELIEQFTTKL